MTELYKKIKIPAQDDPITVTQLRLLRENMNVLKWQHRNTIWCSAWRNSASHTATNEFYVPPCWIPENTHSLLIYIHSQQSTGSTITDDLDLTIGVQVVTESVNFSDGTDYNIISVTCEPGNRNSWQPITWGSCGTSDLKLLSFAVYAVGSTELATGQMSDPAWLEVADHRVLRRLGYELNNLNSNRPQFLGGTLDPYEMTLDAPTEIYRLYHLLDAADDTLSEDKRYSVQVKVGPTKIGCYNGVIQVNHRQSTDTDSIEYTSGDFGENKYIALSVDGESYSTTASSESAILIQPYRARGSGTTDNPEIDSLGIWCYDPLPYSTNRSQGTYRTAVDLDYWDLISGEYADSEVVNGVAGALHNSIIRRAGQCVAWMESGGYTATFGTTPETICTLPIWMRNYWDVEVDDLGDINISACFIVKNNSANTRDVRLTLTDAESSNSITVSDSVAASATKYIKGGGTFTLGAAPSTYPYVVPVTAQIDSDASASLTIYSIWFARFTDSAY